MENTKEVKGITFGPLHRFNTGRQYGVNGQPIAWATFNHDGVAGIVFSDSARDITHCIELLWSWPDEAYGEPTDEYVLDCYDRNKYQDDSEVMRAFNPYHSDPMANLRAALPELEGVDGITVVDLDAVFDRMEAQGDAGLDPVAMGEWLAESPEGQALTGVVPEGEQEESMNTTHTPGPWHINDHTPYQGIFVSTEDYSPVCEIIPQAGIEAGIGRMRADGNLIAAAPTLLQALRDIAAETTHFDSEEIIASIQGICAIAIAKAEGRA